MDFIDVVMSSTLIIIFFVFTIGVLLFHLFLRIEYNKSLYKKITKKSYFSVLFNSGVAAEYLTWEILNKQPEYKKILLNLYIPKGDNTTEIDSILINKHGIFVIESKGYSGWIFGNEFDKYWTQVIYKNRYKFYNPVKQNRNHILALAKILDIEDISIFRSYIVFSERCELKRVKVEKTNVKVIKRDNLQNTLNNDYKRFGEVLTYSQIREIYDKLFEYMFEKDDIKERHAKYVEYIKNMEINRK